MSLTGVHHVLLACPAGSEPALRAFYVGVLAMVEIVKPAALEARGGAWFRSGAVELHLGVEADFRPARKAHPGLLVDDLTDVTGRLRAAGIEVRWDDDFPGHRRCHVDDPVGNRIELLQPV